MSRHHRGKRLWQYQRQLIFDRDDYACAECGARGGRLECDHVVPISQGGTDEPDNLQTLCRECHIAKTRRESGAKPVRGADDWNFRLHQSRFQRARP